MTHDAAEPLSGPAGADSITCGSNTSERDMRITTKGQVTSGAKTRWPVDDWPRSAKGPRELRVT